MNESTFNGKQEVDNFLQHFGILGMHWGRRARMVKKTGKIIRSVHGKRVESDPWPIHNFIKRKLADRKSKQESSRSEDENAKRQLQKKKIHQMSNAELQKLNTRLQLEKSYKELTKADVSPGRKFVTDLLVGAAKQSLSTALNKGAAAGIELALSKAKPKPQMSWNF